MGTLNWESLHEGSIVLGQTSTRKYTHRKHRIWISACNILVTKYVVLLCVCVCVCVLLSVSYLQLHILLQQQLSVLTSFQCASFCPFTQRYSHQWWGLCSLHKIQSFWGKELIGFFFMITFRDFPWLLHKFTKQIN
jgi:hypothetical protein